MQAPALEMRCHKMPAWVSFLLFRLNNGGFFSFLPSPFNNRIPALTLLSSRFSPCKSKAKRLRKPFGNQHSDFLYAQKPDTWARIKISLLTSFLSSPGNIPSSLRSFSEKSWGHCSEKDDERGSMIKLYSAAF